MIRIGIVGLGYWGPNLVRCFSDLENCKVTAVCDQNHDSRQLQQQNVTRVYDLGVYGGHRYLTMELLVGETLESRLRRPLRLDEGLDYLIQACAGLQAAHDHGIVHCDLKPANVVVDRTGHVFVTDFGLSSFSFVRTS